VGEKAMITECDTHTSGNEKCHEHSDNEGIESELVEVDRCANDGRKKRKNEETARSPVDAIKRDVFKHED
jgi:hypothetical protein